MLNAQHTFEVIVRGIAYQACGVLAFELRLRDEGELPPFTAGAHIDLVLPGAMVRSYSLVNSQNERHRYVIAVGRDPASRGGSRYLHDTLRVGDSLQIGRPRNNFCLDESARRSVFIAGGIGITPILSMIRRLEDLGGPWTLHYATRGRDSAAYLQDVFDLARGRPECLQTHFDDEQPGQLLGIQSIIDNAAPEAHLYCCGPAPMLRAFEHATSAWPSRQVHIEYFSSKEPPSTTGGFDVVLARSGRTIFIPPGTTILEKLISEKVDLAFSCKEGTCGTCEVRVLGGIPDHRDVVLSDAEKEANKSMMICCSGAKTAKLILDIE